MKIRYIISGLTAVFVLSNTAFANSSEVDAALIDARQKIANQYILDLQNADYKNIVQLFEKNGKVVSTSRGEMDAKEFFYAFLPYIQEAKTEIHQFFKAKDGSDKLAVRFHFTYKMKDGEEGEGEYIDEFIFAHASAKLTQVYMFENLKFKS